LTGTEQVRTLPRFDRTTMNDSLPPKPKRHWNQFSLRTLLVFVLVLSVPLGWFAMTMQRARRQREAVEGIRELYGDVSYDCQVHKDGEHSNQPPKLDLRHSAACTSLGGKCAAYSPDILVLLVG